MPSKETDPKKALEKRATALKRLATANERRLNATGKRGRLNVVKLIAERFAQVGYGEDGAQGYLEHFLDQFLLQAQDPMSPSYALLATRIISPDIMTKLDDYVTSKRSEDEDFMAYRVAKRCFDRQREYVMSWAPRSYAMCGRRAGKTEGNRLKTMIRSIPSDSRVLILGLTVETTLDLYYQPMLDLYTEFGIKVSEASRIDKCIRIKNRSEVHFGGNTDSREREKYRGFDWDLVIIDEAQSQPALPYLIDSIIQPSLLDRRGVLCITGTGPRVRGTYWEHLWCNDPTASRFSWNLTANPTIPDAENALAAIREHKGLTETSPLYVREYLGQIAYDDDALVYRLEQANYYTDAELAGILAGVPISDVRITGGLDFGFDDADAFAFILHIEGRPQNYLIHEYKARRTGTKELTDAIKAAMELLKASPIYGRFGEAWRQCLIYADTGALGKKITYDLNQQYGLPIMAAYKHDKKLGVELLQDKVKRGMFKVREGSIFADEALKTIFARDGEDRLTREIDDTTYHPDLLDAVLYAERAIDLFGRK